MNTNSGAMSLIANRAIGTKVAIGFACVLAILGDCERHGLPLVPDRPRRVSPPTCSVYRWWGSPVMSIASFLNLRRFAREYALIGIESNVEAATKEQAIAAAAVAARPGRDQEPGAASPARGGRPQFRGILRRTSANSWRRSHEQKKLVEGTLDPLGASLQQNFDALIAAAAKAGNGSVSVLGYEGRQQLMLARLNANKLLGRHEQAAADAAEKSFANLTAALQALDAATKGADFRKTLRRSAGRRDQLSGFLSRRPPTSS